ncbi:hypothetical protein BEWA_004310 [Theileria equi strain WA]|uniref:Uncharacterized protein n=1 Tax=Theileria equi strain WA TaxID=1537102 RepID=L0B0K0_THEEQ|nr:hypothetical protein BEWA_004310 [Theileria equi strain WA]AFZ81023.1 hypothetical protein BEWA_004310 [Theileria equi strain WA]|eukprot:XP_004830689.1 hypothetical protein BEWA_004310 [Theileria equi strain WA]
MEVHPLLGRYRPNPELSEAAKACKTSLVFDAVEVNQVKEKVDLAEAIISSISNAELENTLEIVDVSMNGLTHFAHRSSRISRKTSDFDLLEEEIPHR